MRSLISAATFGRVLLLSIFISLTVALNHGQAIATRGDELVVRAEQRLSIPSLKLGNCYPGSGWMLTPGTSQPETAAQIQHALRQLGLETLVRAVSYGETDSCGDFRMFGVDFSVEIIAYDVTDISDQNELAGLIHSKLKALANPNLGNVKISYPDGNSIHFQGGKNISQSQSLQVKGLSAFREVTQVDAALGWQDTEIHIDKDKVIDLEVIDGEWTHALFSADFNNGAGGSYICTDYIPPESCVEPMPEVPQGALIGKIGDYMFAVGSGTRVTVQQSGNLHLRINDSDDALHDNLGVLNVEVKEPPKQDVVHRSNVYIVVYDPLLSNGQLLSEYLNWADHEDMTQDTIELFNEASDGRVLYSVVDTTIITDGWPALVDGYQYSEDEYFSIIDGTSDPHSPDNVDYNKIVNDPALDICGRANRGEIDEVWIFNGPWFGFWESTLVGPGSYWYNSPPVPGPFTCNRIIPIMGPSPERPDMLGHGEGHRMESTMTQTYGGWEQNRTAHNWDRFGLVDWQSPDYSYSGCGSIHYPPNGTSDYDYSNPSVAGTNCNDFSNYPELGDPLLTVEPISCSEWECDHYGYMLYWFGHLPSNAGCGPDGVANDWWLYFLKPELALEPSSACQLLTPTLSINYSTGQPGSFFTITGFNFPPNKAVTIEINGAIVNSPVIHADSSGNLAFILSTTNAEAGYYWVTLTFSHTASISVESLNSADESVTTSFELDPTYPLRPKSGDGLIIPVPGGNGYLGNVFIPMVQGN